LVNISYNRGRAKEYRIKKKLEKEGWIVLRTSGSHGFADLIAIKKDEINFIQSKPRKFSETQKKKLMDKYDWINNEFMCKFLII